MANIPEKDIKVLQSSTLANSNNGAAPNSAPITPMVNVKPDKNENHFFEK